MITACPLSAGKHFAQMPCWGTDALWDNAGALTALSLIGSALLPSFRVSTLRE